MAYNLTYWASDGKPDAYSELKHIRLKSIEEAFTLALPHNRPSGTALITVERHRNYKGKKWIAEKTVWEKGMDYPSSPVRYPNRTKK
jgi:hypothetical protein